MSSFQIVEAPYTGTLCCALPHPCPGLAFRLRGSDPPRAIWTGRSPWTAGSPFSAGGAEGDPPGSAPSAGWSAGVLRELRSRPAGGGTCRWGCSPIWGLGGDHLPVHLPGRQGRGTGPGCWRRWSAAWSRRDAPVVCCMCCGRTPKPADFMSAAAFAGTAPRWRSPCRRRLCVPTCAMSGTSTRGGTPA